VVNGHLPEPIAVTLLVARVLDDLAVPYAVVGSLASSFHGIPRSTNDVDLVAALRVELVTGNHLPTGMRTG
jgi:hypothetical protein